MSALPIYLLLLKATLTSFSGLTSLPVVRHDFVETRHALTDRQLNAAVAVGRTTPGPYGLYLVSVGYFAGGWSGACAASFPSCATWAGGRTGRGSRVRSKPCCSRLRGWWWTPPFRWRATRSRAGWPWPSQRVDLCSWWRPGGTPCG
ncbi:MAG: chromate transporter [Acidobacteriia bacterium]|nr:chromate transporter [Terriglobia bacterium]